MDAIRGAIGDLLKERARFSPRLEALIGPAKRMTFAEFNAIANQIAHFMRSKGIRTGDRVAVLASTDCFCPVLYMAIYKAGAIAVPLNWRQLPEEMEWVIQDSSPVMLLYEDLHQKTVSALRTADSIRAVQVVTLMDWDTRFQSEFQRMPPTEPDVEINPDQPALLLYTSGTTGRPKGVMITHANMVSTAFINGYSLMNLRIGDRMLFVTPLYHISGTGLLAIQPLLGATYVFMPEFDFNRYVEVLEKERITHTLLVPALLRLLFPMLLETERDLSALKEIISGGSTVEADLIQKYASLGFQITQIYASTETGSIAMWKPDMGIEHCHTVGKPFLTEIRIVDPETKEELPPGEVGEIAVKGPSVFIGYWNNPEETARVLRDGWYYTGDAGRMDEEGFLEIVDRYKDVINCSGGEKIFPAQVEKVILQLDEVAEAAVIGVKDKIWGELPRACVVKKPGSLLTEEYVLSYVHQHLARYKLRDVVFVDSLPRNSLGKVLKTVLREQAAESAD